MIPDLTIGKHIFPAGGEFFGYFLCLDRGVFRVYDGGGERFGLEALKNGVIQRIDRVACPLVISDHPWRKCQQGTREEQASVAKSTE